MTNTCINCFHKDVCYKYRLNYVCAREGTCTNFMSKSDWVEKKVPIGYDYGDVNIYKKYKETDEE